jgi:hypothetical protein
MGEPVRTCVACRRKGAKGEFVKLADTPSGVVLDYQEKLPGRGAHVCVELSCIKAALDGRPLSRAFKRKSSPPALEVIVEGIINGAERKAVSLLGMARKSGNAACGYDAAVEEIKKHPGGVLVLAGDISENTRKKLKSVAPDAFGNAESLSTRDGLGLLFGTAPVAVVYVSDRGLSSALKREFGRITIINRG